MTRRSRFIAVVALALSLPRDAAASIMEPHFDRLGMAPHGTGFKQGPSIPQADTPGPGGSEAWWLSDWTLKNHLPEFLSQWFPGESQWGWNGQGVPAGDQGHDDSLWRSDHGPHIWWDYFGSDSHQTRGQQFSPPQQVGGRGQGGLGESSHNGDTPPTGQNTPDTGGSGNNSAPAAVPEPAALAIWFLLASLAVAMRRV